MREIIMETGTLSYYTLSQLLKIVQKYTINKSFRHEKEN